MQAIEIRANLSSVEAAIVDRRARLATLEKLRSSYCALLSRNKPSMRSTVRDILREAGGRPVHLDEILATAAGRGFTTRSKRPDNLMHLIVTVLQNEGWPVEHVAVKTWSWIP